MKLTWQDQIDYSRLALKLLGENKQNSDAIEIILAFGELVKNQSEENNYVIYDATEYVYEILKLSRGEGTETDVTSLRRNLELEVLEK